MPKVGKEKFPYTSAGVAQAQKRARATGQKVDMAGYKKGGTKKKYKAGGTVKKRGLSNKRSISLPFSKVAKCCTGISSTSVRLLPSP